MKRVVVAILLCICLLSATAYAVVPLAPIAAAAIGASLLTVLGASNTKVALNPQGSFGYDGPDLTVPVAVYNQYMQAGASIALGYLTSIPYDMAEAYRLGLLQAEPEIFPTLNELFASPGPPPPGSTVVGPTGAHWRIASDWSDYSYRYKWWIDQQFANPTLVFPGGNDIVWLDIGTTVMRVNWSDKHPDYDAYHCWVAQVVNDEESPLYQPSLPSVLTPEQAQQLSQSLSSQAANDQDTREALENVVKNNPGLLGQPASITPAQVQAYAQQAAQEAVAANIQAIQAALDADPTNVALQLQLAAAQSAAQQAAAQQLAEQAAQEAAKETFSPISDNPFTAPYNPGEYDIPARFTTFLNRVKSTGLFSFSADFFNSLPGGGSPIYEIEAGQYGHHTIDLSQTLTVGLAVLKTILLACFGFLSIRAVIMKR